MKRWEGIVRLGDDKAKWTGNRRTSSDVGLCFGGLGEGRLIADVKCEPINDRAGGYIRKKKPMHDR